MSFTQADRVREFQARIERKERGCPVTRAQLESDVEAFLAQGGQINEVPFGTLAEREQYRISKSNGRPRRVSL